MDAFGWGEGVRVVLLTAGGPTREAKDEIQMAGKFSEILMYVLLPVFPSGRTESRSCWQDTSLSLTF